MKYSNSKQLSKIKKSVRFSVSLNAILIVAVFCFVHFLVGLFIDSQFSGLLDLSFCLGYIITMFMIVKAHKLFLFAAIVLLLGQIAKEHDGYLIFLGLSATLSFLTHKILSIEVNSRTEDFVQLKNGRLNPNTAN